MTDGTLLEQVRQGDPTAIATLLNHYLQRSGITARAALRDRVLHLLLEAAQVPDQQALVAYVRRGMQGLKMAMAQPGNGFDTVMIYGRRQGEQAAAWTETLDLTTLASPSTAPSAAGSATGSATGSAAGSATVATPPAAAAGLGAALGLAAARLGAEAVPPDIRTGPPTPPAPSATASPTPVAPPGSETTAVPPISPLPMPATPAPEPPVGISGGAEGEPGSVIPPVVPAPSAPPSPPPPAAVTPSGASSAQMQEASCQGLLAKGLLALLLLGFLGYVGWMLWTVSQQKQTISAAQSLTAGAIDVDKATNLNELKAAQQKLKDAETMLSAVPDIPGSAYANAQAELVKVRERLQQVEERLQAETKAQENLTAAVKLAAEATALGKLPNPTIASWKEAEAKWLAAINYLATIPPTSFLYPDASQRLAAYRNNYLLARQEVINLGGEVQPISGLGGSPEALGRQK